MKSESASFNSITEFQHFKDVMRKVVSVSKAELDKQVRLSKPARKRSAGRSAKRQASKQ